MSACQCDICGHVHSDAGRGSKPELAAQARIIDSALEALRPFARAGAHFAANKIGPGWVLEQVADEPPLTTGDCLRAADEWRKARPGVEP